MSFRTRRLRTAGQRPMPFSLSLPSAIAVLLTCAACGQAPIPTVVAVASPAALHSGEVNLAATNDGKVVMSWIEQNGPQATLKYATLGSARWSEPRVVASGTGWFVNWADFPSVVPVSDDVWAAHWLVRSGESPHAYDVAVSLSTDGGHTWPAPIKPHNDATQTEHGFVTLFPWHDEVGAVWLDGRNTANEYDPDKPAASGMTLRAASISRNLRVTNDALVDDLVCDCCQTDVALTANGAVVAYRNRSENDIRDIYVARFEGGEWQPGAAVFDDGWKITGCPVNGPTIAASGNSVALAWFTAVNDRPSVKIAFSSDGGERFDEPLELDIENTLGRLDLLLWDDGSALLSSLKNNGDGTAEVLLHRVGAQGSTVTQQSVATTGAGRLSGFPRLARTDDRVVVAWTDSSEAGTQVRTALVTP